MHTTTLLVNRRRTLAACLVLSLLASGCAARQFGPRAVVPAQRGYHEAISTAIDQQLLLNLVRLRYRDNPLFLEFASIVTQFSRSASLGASLKLVGGADEGSFSAGVAASESPVLTLVPVKGREFVQRMLAPIQAESLVALVQSGWSIERLLKCCVQEIARLSNAVGKDRSEAAELDRFHRLARALGEVQKAGGLDLTARDQGALHFDLGRVAPSALAVERGVLEAALGMAPLPDRFRLTGPRSDPQQGDVVFVGRSFYGILQLLSQGVEIPAEPSDGGAVLGGIFAARSGPARPRDPALAISYRGLWFWVSDDDRESKTTFSLLSLLTSLKASEAIAQTPVLAIGR